MALNVLEENPHFNQSLFEERRQAERQRALAEGPKHDRRFEANIRALKAIRVDVSRLGIL